MKKLIVLFLLLISITSFAKSDLYDLLKDSQMDLAYGVVLPDLPNYADFSVRFSTNTSAAVHTSSFEAFIPFQEAADKWYLCDFAEDPFNGVIEIYAVGQPSASTTATLIISLLCGLLMFRKRLVTV